MERLEAVKTDAERKRQRLKQPERKWEVWKIKKNKGQVK
jgi:hypothetical protein